MTHPRVYHNGDDLYCPTCGKTWGRDDPDPPGCLPPKPRHLTLFQRLALDCVERGVHIDATPGALTATERKQLDALVSAGRLRLTKSGYMEA